MINYVIKSHQKESEADLMYRLYTQGNILVFDHQMSNIDCKMVAFGYRNNAVSCRCRGRTHLNLHLTTYNEEKHGRQNVLE